MELLTSTQLLEHAGSRRKAEGLLREGRWWRVVRGAYAPVGRADDVATRAAAYRLVVPPRTAASHRAALWLLGLDVLDEGHAGRTDFHLRGVVLEYDGRAERLKKPVFVAERRRQTRMAADRAGGASLHLRRRLRTPRSRRVRGGDAGGGAGGGKGAVTSAHGAGHPAAAPSPSAADAG